LLKSYQRKKFVAPLVFLKNNVLSKED